MGGAERQKGRPSWTYAYIAYNQPDALLRKEWRPACKADSRAECLYSQHHLLLFCYFSSIVFLFWISHRSARSESCKERPLIAKGFFFSISDLVGQFQNRLNKHCFPAEALLGHSSPREHSIRDSREWHAPCPEADLSELAERGVVPAPTWLLFATASPTKGARSCFLRPSALLQMCE